MAFAVIDHTPNRAEISEALSKLLPYQGMLLFDWPPRGYTPQEPTLLGWIQREAQADGDNDFWGGSHGLEQYRGYISLQTATELVQQLQPNYVLYGHS